MLAKILLMPPAIIIASANLRTFGMHTLYKYVTVIYFKYQCDGILQVDMQKCTS